MWLYKENYNSWVASHWKIYKNNRSARCPECRMQIDNVWDYLLKHNSKFKVLDNDGSYVLKIHYGKHECGANIAVIDDNNDSHWNDFLMKDFSDIWKNDLESCSEMKITISS